jgi:hypothetical protein
MHHCTALEELAACEDAGFISLVETSEAELHIRLDATDPGRVFDIRFTHYVSYAVRSEHYCQWDNDEVWAGKHVYRIYSKSKFLDFVAGATFATDDFPWPFKHYQFQSLYQIIDVASRDEPIVSVAPRAPAA